MMEDYSDISATIVESIRSPDGYDMPKVADRMRAQTEEAKRTLETVITKMHADGTDPVDVVALLNACYIAANMGLMAQIIDAATEASPSRPTPSTAFH